ncbi:MAG: hypothetical protein HY890_08265 [Deltaproteobacteria bacterium]|nr:hypothetical protein [Deltaproteobacteria bacterium]
MFYVDLLEQLYRHQVKYLIVGGLAVNLYGVPRVTQDIDIIVSITPDNIRKLNKILKGLDYIPRLPVNPDDMASPDILKGWIKNKNLKAFSFYHRRQNYKVVDVVLVHPLDFEASFNNKVIKKAEGIEIYIASIDDIVKMKEFSGRSQDLSDIEMLKKAKRYMEAENE